MIQEIIDLLGSYSISESTDIITKSIQYICAAWLLYLFIIEVFGLFRTIIKSIFK